MVIIIDNIVTTQISNVIPPHIKICRGKISVLLAIASSLSSGSILINNPVIMNASIEKIIKIKVSFNILPPNKINVLFFDLIVQKPYLQSH